MGRQMKLDKWFLFTIFIILLSTIFEFYPALFNGYYISGDSRQQMFPFHRFYDSSLFYKWELCDQTLRYLPFGFTGLNFILSRFMSLYTITLFLPFLLSLLTVTFIYRVAEFLTKSGRFSFLISFIFMLVYYSSDFGRGGTMRAFGFLFIAAFLYYMLRQDKIKVYSTIFISCWVYPISMGMFLFALFFELLITLANYRHKQKNSRRLVAGFLFFIVALALNLAVPLRMHPFSPFSDKPARQYNMKEAMAMPEFGPKGTAEPSNRLIRNREYLFSLSFIYDQLLFIEEYNKKLAWIWPFIFISVFTLSFILKRKNNMFVFLTLILMIVSAVTIYYKIVDVYGVLIWCLLSLAATFLAFYGKIVLKLPAAIWYMLAAGIAMFVIIYCLPYEIAANLHCPAHQLGLVLPVFLVIFCGYNYYRVMCSTVTTNSKYVFFIFGVIIIVLYLVNYDRHLHFAKDKSLYKYLSSLPKDITVAGHPSQMDFIPLFAKRKILVYEEIDPFIGPDFWPKYKERTYDVFRALYGHSSDEFNEFCKKYKDEDIYFVIDRYYFSHQYLDADRIYFEPFDTFIRKLTYEGNFFFANLSDDKKVFTADDVFVVRCKDSCL